MSKIISVVAQQALKEALCAIYWYKNDLRSFLQNCIISGIASKMKSEIREWIKSFKMSHSGADYGVPFKPVNEFPEIFEEK